MPCATGDGHGAQEAGASRLEVHVFDTLHPWTSLLYVHRQAVVVFRYNLLELIASTSQQEAPSECD